MSQTNPWPLYENKGHVPGVHVAEALFNCCTDAFIREFVPDMQLIYERQYRSWLFPTGYPLYKIRKTVGQLWPVIPAEAKQEFVLRQLTNAGDQVRLSFMAIEGAGFRLSDEQFQAAQQILQQLQDFIRDCREPPRDETTYP